MEFVYGLLACLAAISHNPDTGSAAHGARQAKQPWVTEQQGAVIYHDRQARECALTPPENFTQPQLSPDGKWAIEVPGSANDESDKSLPRWLKNNGG